ncbi:MAG: MATE family efflux transporter [Oscillospiraceae bacterium]|nr:MATE family efflux transporter [Oscillospiraceae bacterium]
MSERIPENKMGVMPVGKLLLNMALPMVISMLVQALYNVVDSIYVSQVSENAVTALSLAFPIQNIQIGAAVGIGVGVNALLSKSLGEKNHAMANFAAGNGLLLACVCTAAIMIFGIFGVRPYYLMQNTSAATAEAGMAYSGICCIFTLGVFLEILFERLLQATGRTFHTMITQGVGAVANIVLDPVFIFGVDMLGIPAMGAAGAAIATVIGQWMAAALALIFNIKCNPDVKLGLEFLRPRADAIRPILTVGVPSAIMNGIGSITNFTMNQILLGFQAVGETASGVFGIYFKLQSFFFMPLFGMNNAAISIVAYNYGARKPERIIRTLKIAYGAALTLMICGTLAFQLIPEVLLGLFNPSDAFLEIGCAALRNISWHFPVAAFSIIMISSFQALGNGIYSTVVSLCRQLIALLPAAYLLSLSGVVNRVWWAFCVAEAVSALVCALFFLRIYRRKIKPLFAEK